MFPQVKGTRKVSSSLRLPEQGYLTNNIYGIISRGFEEYLSVLKVPNHSDTDCDGTYVVPIVITYKNYSTKESDEFFVYLDVRFKNEDDYFMKNTHCVYVLYDILDKFMTMYNVKSSIENSILNEIRKRELVEDIDEVDVKFRRCAKATGMETTCRCIRYTNGAWSDGGFLQKDKVSNMVELDNRVYVRDKYERVAGEMYLFKNKYENGFFHRFKFAFLFYGEDGSEHWLKDNDNGKEVTFVMFEDGATKKLTNRENVGDIGTCSLIEKERFTDICPVVFSYKVGITI